MNKGEKVLFKYLPSDRIDVIENLSIRFSQLSSFNDYNETLHSTNIEEALDKKIEEYRKKIQSLHKKVPKKEREKKKNKKIYKAIMSDFNNEAHYAKLKAINEKTKNVTSLSKLLDTEIGILSLSKKNNIDSMWGHYASSFTGYVIGFDSNHDFFHKENSLGNKTSPVEVIYTDVKPLIDPKSNSIHQDVYRYKTKNWSVEQEVRIARTFSGVNPLKDSNHPILDNFNNKIYLFDLPKDSIKSIYFGINMSKENKKKLIKACFNHNLNCDFFDMRYKNSKIKYKRI